MSTPHQRARYPLGSQVIPKPHQDHTSLGPMKTHWGGDHGLESPGILLTTLMPMPCPCVCPSSSSAAISPNPQPLTLPGLVVVTLAGVSMCMPTWAPPVLDLLEDSPRLFRSGYTE